MEQKYIDEFRTDLNDFFDMTHKFYAGEIDAKEYKGFSGGFGSYAQRGGRRNMLRLRLAGGEVDKDKIKFIADSIDRYDIDMAHFTTCQSLQLHNLTEQNVCDLIAESFEHGIVTRGGGGDFPRNVMCSPLSGVEPGESFDVLPYAREAADYLLTFIKKVRLPRKLKVGFANSKRNETHVTFRDLGFLAKENQKFDVYCAGGLGNNPKFGVRVVEDIEPSKILYCIKTMIDVFTEYGNYENRAKSRTRFLQDTLGADELKRIFKEKLEGNFETESLDINVVDSVILKTSDIKSEDTCGNPFNANPRVIRQKQNGLYAVKYHPVAGIIKKGFFKKLYETIKDMPEVLLRIAADGGAYIINLTEDEANRVIEITDDSAKSAFECSTACIGADICQVGIGRSRIVLQECVEQMRKENFPDGVLPSIHISGCPSSCSAHQTAAIGFRGGKKPTADGAKYAFAMYVNGCDEAGKEAMGTCVGVILEEDIVRFLTDLGREVAKSGLCYDGFVRKYPDALMRIASNYI